MLYLRVSSIVFSALLLFGGGWCHAQEQSAGQLRKPEMKDTIKATIYADNTFQLFINGELVAVDSIRFIPHNVIEVDILPAYPLTIAVLAEDNADPKTGMEYANTNIGDGGFILKFGDGTVTDSSWRALAVSHGPIDGDTKNPRVKNDSVPDGWNLPGFDDSGWAQAREYSEEEVGPKQPYFEHDFKGAKFIWSNDVKLDNKVLFRRVLQTPPDGKTRTDFSNLNNVIPAGGGADRAVDWFGVKMRLTAIGSFQNRLLYLFRLHRSLSKHAFLASSSNATIRLSALGPAYFLSRIVLQAARCRPAEYHLHALR